MACHKNSKDKIIITVSILIIYQVEKENIGGPVLLAAKRIVDEENLKKKKKKKKEKGKKKKISKVVEEIH